MTEKEYSVLDELKELGLPNGSFMVMGSGILDALGIRKANDVDLVVSSDVYAQLQDSGWSSRVASNGSQGLEHGVFQAYDSWTDETTVKKLTELLPDAEWVNGIAYNSLAKLSLYKARRGLAKDFDDLVRINEYLLTHVPPASS